MYDTSVVRLERMAEGRTITAGMGVLVGRREVVTCAHVVNTALGRPQRAQEPPEPERLIRVVFPLLPGSPSRDGLVRVWVPPPERGEGDGDIAGVVLSEEAPANVIPARFTADIAATPGEKLRVFGYPQSPPRERGAWVDVDVKGVVGGQLIQVESREDQTIKAQPGYSGSPVWHHGSGKVAGLLHAAPFPDKPDRDAYLLPAGSVAEAWEEQFEYLLLPPNPYRGLEPFTADDAALFFGRDSDVEKLTVRVLAQPVVVVVGASGVGKSSLVQAGLIPELQKGGTWSVEVIRLGDDPWYQLAAAVLRMQSGTNISAAAGEMSSRISVDQEILRLRREGLNASGRFLRSLGRPPLLVIDQFEELLTHGEPPDPQLMDLLLPAREVPVDPVRIVLTLRSDYLPTLLDIPGMGPRLDQRLYLLSQLTDNQLRQAVTLPATGRGVRFESGLVDLIVRETGARSLPLAQFTLTRLWNTQRRKTLSFFGYNKIGGVSGALDQFAEQHLRNLPRQFAAVADQVLLRLVHTPAAELRLAARQRAYRSDMPADEWETARRLAGSRLLTVDTDDEHGPYGELAHEALITSWRRLHRIVSDNADFLAWLAWARQRAIEGDAVPEARIAEARQWVDSRGDAIPAEVREFIGRSQIAAEARLGELRQARDRAEALRLAADAELALRSSTTPTTLALALGAESLLTQSTAQGDRALRGVLRLHARPVARLDHGGRVFAVAFSPDGARVVTGSGDNSARVFDAVTGAELARLDHDGAVRAVAFSPDGARVVTGSDYNSARVFDAVTGAELARLDHDGAVRAVAFSPDGARVATGSYDNSARVFDAVTGAELARLYHGGLVHAVAFSPDGARVATGSDDNSARVFDAATGAELTRLDHNDSVHAVAFSPDGARVATGSTDNSARVFDAATGAELARLYHGGLVHAVAFSPDGARVATGSTDNSARVFDAATGAELTRLGHDDSVHAVAFSPDGARVATGSADNSARVFDAATGAELARLDHDGSVHAVAFSPDGARVATGSADNSARVFDAATGAELARLDHDDSVDAVAFSPDGARVATGSYDNSARVFDAVTGAELARLDHDGRVSAVAFSPDGARVATGSFDNSARVFDAVTGAELARLDHDDSVYAVAFSPDGARVATGSGDNSARVFDAVTGAELARLDHGGSVHAVAFSPDGARVATGSYDNSARVFDAVTGAELARLDHGGLVHAVAFSPDGARVATGSFDNSARVFDAVTGAELARLHHDGAVIAVAFSPDGARVATGSTDNSARVFDAVTGAELARLDHDGLVYAVAFSPDGARVATGSDDNSARVFDAVTGAELARLDHDDSVDAVAFSPDGARVATGSFDNSARVFDIEPNVLLRRVFAVMTRPLQFTELRRYSLPEDCLHLTEWQRRQHATELP